MKQLYTVYIGVGVDLLFSRERIVVNCYSEDSSDYQIFETTAREVSRLEL